MFMLNFSQYNLKIRDVKLEDLDAIHNIDAVSFGSHCWSKDVFKTEIKNSYSKYYVCTLINPKETILGYIGLWNILDECHIVTLAVSPLYRRKHVADILLYNSIHQCVKINMKWLTLEVRASNIPAINLYKKYGFSQLGIRKKYYQDNNEDGLIFWFNIANLQNLNSLELVGSRINYSLCFVDCADKCR